MGTLCLICTTKGWGPAGDFGHRVFATEAKALAASRAAVPWLDR